MSLRVHSLGATMRRRTKEKPKPKHKSLTSTKPVPLNDLTRRRVVMARIPYSEPDRNEYKIRPAVVVRRSGRTVWVSPVTTKARGAAPIDLSGTGLSRRSFLRLDLVELDRVDVVSVMGEVSEEVWALLADRFPDEGDVS